jgi:hypothetical protein
MTSPPVSYANLSVTPDTVASAVYPKLNGDVTLRGSSMLVAASRVFKGGVPRRVSGADAPLPRLLIVGGDIVPMQKEGFLFRATLDVEARAKNIGGGLVPDQARLGRICGRVCDLLRGWRTVTRAGASFFDCQLVLIGPARESVESVEESTMLARFTIDVRAST